MEKNRASVSPRRSFRASTARCIRAGCPFWSVWDDPYRDHRLWWSSGRKPLKMTELSADKSMARKRKTDGVSLDKAQEVLPEARFVAPLRKPADVTMERKRLYRAVING